MKTLYVPLTSIEENDAMRASRDYPCQLVPPITNAMISCLSWVMVGVFGLISLTFPYHFDLLVQKGFMNRLGLPHQYPIDFDGYSKKIFRIVQEENLFSSKAFTHFVLNCLPKRTLELLFTHGCDLNTCSTSDHSIVSTATAAMMHPRMIRLLLDVGCRPYGTSTYPSENLHILSSLSSDNYVYARIISYSAPGDFEDWSHILKDLVTRGFTCHTGLSCRPDHHLAREVFLAVASNNKHALRQLISHGAFISWEQFSHTPLTLAVKLGLVDIVQILIDSGLPTDCPRGVDVSESCLKSSHPRKIPFVISQSFDPFLDLQVMMEDLALYEMKDTYDSESQDLWSRSITRCFNGDPWIQLDSDQKINDILMNHCKCLGFGPPVSEKSSCSMCRQLFNSFQIRITSYG